MVGEGVARAQGQNVTSLLVGVQGEVLRAVELGSVVLELVVVGRRWVHHLHPSGCDRTYHTLGVKQ